MDIKVDYHKLIRTIEKDKSFFLGYLNQKYKPAEEEIVFFHDDETIILGWNQKEGFTKNPYLLTIAKKGDDELSVSLNRSSGKYLLFVGIFFLLKIIFTEDPEDWLTGFSILAIGLFIGYFLHNQYDDNIKNNIAEKISNLLSGKSIEEA